MSDLIEILHMDGPTKDTFDHHKIFVAKVTMSFPASFYSNINYLFSKPCLGYINMKTSFWHTYGSLK